MLMAEDENGHLQNGTVWKNNLYLLQEQAPQPVAVLCTRKLDFNPPQYGKEFHGLIDRTDSEVLLRNVGEGAFLVRQSKRSDGAYTLCLYFDDRVLNYKLFYDGSHYVGDKRFKNIYDLVRDGLICMYIDKYAADYIRQMTDEVIYEHSPYSLYNKSIERPQQQMPRAHSFVTATFTMPQYCDYCRNFLWGLVQQGVKCEDCGFAAHRKCSERALQDCHPDAKYIKRIFAIDLTTVCMAHKTQIPVVVTSCIKEVESRGLGVEGIYRVSASHEQMEKLKRQYDSQARVDLSHEDIYTVCGLLKLYLRLLPQQLVPFTVYRSLLGAFTNVRTTHEKRKNIIKALSELTDANARTLKAILCHLKTVSEHAVINKMSAENLSTIFSPTLFCTGVTPALPQQQHVLLHYLIQHPYFVPEIM